MSRLNVKDFIISHDADKRKDVEKYFRQTEVLLTQSAAAIANPEQRRLLEIVSSGLDRYMAAFGRVITLDGQQRAIQSERLDVSGPAMEKDLTAVMRSAKASGDADAAYNAGETLRSLLLARLYLFRHGASHDPAHAERVRNEMAAMNASLARLTAELKDPERLYFARDAGSHFAKYRAAFEDKVKVSDTLLATIHDELDPTGRRIARSIDELRVVFRTEQDALGPKVVADMAWGIQLNLALLGLGLALGTILAFAIGRSIIGPIVSMTSVMTRLAHGDLSAQVPSRVAPRRNRRHGSRRRGLQATRNGTRGACLAKPVKNNPSATSVSSGWPP